MIISKNKRFIFVHIHKCAGTSVTAAFAPHLTWDDLQLGATPLGEAMNVPYSKSFGLSKHSTAREIQSVVGAQLWNDCFTFSVVRHPFRRQLSLYRFVQGMIRTERFRDRVLRFLRVRERPFFEWPAVRACVATSSFSEFLRHEELQKDPAAQSQFHCLSDEAEEKLLVDYVAKVETLDHDLGVIVERLGLAPLQAGRDNRSRGGATLPHYARADWELIYDRYRIDFEMFGYKPDPGDDERDRPAV